MGSKWRKVKLAFGLNLCVYSPRSNVADSSDDEGSPPPPERRSDATLLSPPSDWASAPATPSSNKFRFSKSLSRSSSKKTCSICLATMKRGEAIFTAECSHSFHFHCITSNVKHGNQICPVCRAKWKEIPFQGPNLDSPMGKARISPLDFHHNNDLMTVIRRLPPPRSNSTRNSTPSFHPPEPAIFNDDESLDHEIDSSSKSFSKSTSHCDDRRKVDIKTYTEVPAVAKSNSSDSFTVLLHLKAPLSNSWHNALKNDGKLSKISHTPRAPVDLVTVLDISGSMAGTKLALLKRAMGFVIQNLGPNDRLAVIAFSSTAHRLFPLRRMSDSGRQQALQGVNSLVANGGTNIAEGLRKGAKIMEDRRENNPNYQLLLPSSIRPDGASGFKLPVHAFGFGGDHDASSMHSISEVSGGTFSFIETESAIQDAFAQCIGGLLSVVVKDLSVRVECVHPSIRLASLKAGSYPNRILSNQRAGTIDVGDLYADEERDFLLSINVPWKGRKLGSREPTWPDKKTLQLMSTGSRTGSGQQRQWHKLELQLKMEIWLMLFL